MRFIKKYFLKTCEKKINLVKRFFIFNNKKNLKFFFGGVLIPAIFFFIAQSSMNLKMASIEESLDINKDKIEEIENPIINCSDIEKDWQNNDLALKINKELKIIRLREHEKSGLIYFEQPILSSFVIIVELEPVFDTSPNIVFYFEDPNTEKGVFKIIIGDNEPNVVNLKYFIDKEWISVEENNQRKRLDQPLATNKKLTIRIETTPDNGDRTVKTCFIYKPGKNINADPQRECFNYTFLDKKIPRFDLAIGLINPSLIRDEFTIEFSSCSIQEIKL